MYRSISPIHPISLSANQDGLLPLNLPFCHINDHILLSVRVVIPSHRVLSNTCFWSGERALYSITVGQRFLNWMSFGSLSARSWDWSRLNMFSVPAKLKLKLPSLSLDRSRPWGRRNLCSRTRHQGNPCRRSGATPQESPPDLLQQLRNCQPVLLKGGVCTFPRIVQVDIACHPGHRGRQDGTSPCTHTPSGSNMHRLVDSLGGWSAHVDIVGCFDSKFVVLSEFIQNGSAGEPNAKDNIFSSRQTLKSNGGDEFHDSIGLVATPDATYSPRICVQGLWSSLRNEPSFVFHADNSNKTDSTTAFLLFGRQQTNQPDALYQNVRHFACSCSRNSFCQGHPMVWYYWTALPVPRSRQRHNINHAQKCAAGVSGWWVDESVRQHIHPELWISPRPTSSHQASPHPPLGALHAPLPVVSSETQSTPHVRQHQYNNGWSNRWRNILICNTRVSLTSIVDRANMNKKRTARATFETIARIADHFAVLVASGCATRCMVAKRTINAVPPQRHSRASFPDFGASVIDSQMKSKSSHKCERILYRL